MDERDDRTRTIQNTTNEAVLGGEFQRYLGTPLRTAVAAGVGTFSAGFLLTSLLSSGARDSLQATLEAVGDWGILNEAAISAPPSWVITGWGFFGAHQASLTGSSEGAVCVTGSEMSGYVQEAIGASGLLQLLVPLVIVAGGYLLTRWARDVENGAKYGASLAAGYFPLALVGVLLFNARMKLDCPEAGMSPVHTFQLDPVFSIFVVGIIYPIVFGAIGGVIAVATE